MTRPFLVGVFLILSSFDLFSQSHTEDFRINLPQQIIKGGLYSTITFIDSRFDTTSMGIVQLGAFNKKAKVVPKIPFSTQLTSVMNALIDSTAKNGVLLFQLRQFSFAEITGSMSEKGYCFLRAELYSNINETYHKVNSIDTVLFIKSMDVTRALFRNGSNAITNLIATSLLKEGSDQSYNSLTDILKIDSIEKRRIKVYNTAEYTDGLYLNYTSFMNQVPDKQITVEMKDEKISVVKIFDVDGNIIKIKKRDIYSIVYKGQPYIATEYGYYPIKRINDDLLFTGKAKTTANTGDVVTASLFFGIIGGLIASDAEAMFEMKIDHLNGGFIHLREIKDKHKG